MPNQKTMERCLTWLNSKIAEKDTLDAINADTCLTVLNDLIKENKRIGALLHSCMHELHKKKAPDDISSVQLSIEDLEV